MRHALKVYWSEIRPDQGIMAHWAELGHALLRLKFSVSEFEEGMSSLKDLQSIYRVHYQLENYYARIYELQERLYSLAAALTKTNKREAKNMLLKPSREATLLSAWPANAKDCIAPLKQILKALADDVEVRNIHTHETFIRLASNEGPRWVDIEDLWWDLEEDTVSMAKAFRAMGKQGIRLVKEYKSRTEYIETTLNVFLKALMPYLSELSV